MPVFGAVPHAEPFIASEAKGSLHYDVSPTKIRSSIARPIKLEWFNGSTIGKDLAHTEMTENAEYMIKEARPHYLSPEYCSRMCFDLTPKTSCPHCFSVISTGRAI